ncbi:MAG TPA: dipeptidase [Kofleriaceae bacterium]|nr:dipeptidase [Kofleriaceae bacterium]
MAEPVGRLLAGLALALLVSACGKPEDKPEDKNEGKDKAASPAAEKKPAASAPAPSAPDREKLTARARELARRFVIMDGHIDVPDRLVKHLDEKGRPIEDVSKRTEEGDFDHPRAVEGGLDAPFMSIYVPSSHQKSGGARKKADQLIDMVEQIAKGHPDKFALAHSSAQVQENSGKQLVSLPLGIENGAAIEDELRNLVHFHRRGVRYITLTHAEDNLICDSSYDDKKTWKGLSPFGRKVVAEMNRLGIMIDVSHISDQAFDQVIELSQVPVIASHSSARHFTPGWERNLDDDRIKALGAKGGVILINFGSSFINDRSRIYFDQMREALKKQTAGRKTPPSDEEREKLEDAYTAQHPPIFATVEQVADHVLRVIELAGVDHVGFGSDFDGVGDSLPEGLKDVSGYPNLIRALLERGLSEADVEKICGGNFLRVWQAVEKHAERAAAGRSTAPTRN